ISNISFLASWLCPTSVLGHHDHDRVPSASERKFLMRGRASPPFPYQTRLSATNSRNTDSRLAQHRLAGGSYSMPLGVRILYIWFGRHPCAVKSVELQSPRG